jgi:hypothetical protein
VEVKPTEGEAWREQIPQFYEAWGQGKAKGLSDGNDQAEEDEVGFPRGNVHSWVVERSDHPIVALRGRDDDAASVMQAP